MNREYHILKSNAPCASTLRVRTRRASERGWESRVRPRSFTIVAAGLVILLAPVVKAQVAAAEVDVLQPAAWPAGVAARAAGSTPVLPDFQRIASLTSGGPARILVAPGAFVDGLVDRVERRAAAQYSVFGRLIDDASSFFILVVEEDALVGLVHAPLRNQAYRIGYVAAGVHEIESVAAKAYGGCATETAPLEMTPELIDARQSLAPACAPPPDEGPLRGVCSAPRQHFDTMIYYTAAARMEAGGVNAMNAECQLAADTANVTYANSGIPARVVLVFRGEITYTETGDFTTDRDRLRIPADGFMDNVHAERNTFGGDFMTLFVSDANYTDCGLAYCLPSDATWGFCVVDRSCASSNFSYAHELGHLQGCAHNREDAGTGCNYYCDSYGHRFSGNTGNWRTVMSYNDDANPTTRIGWFSNALINFDGVPTGAGGGCSTSTNNAGTIFGTTSSREAWRQPRFEVWVGPLNVIQVGTFTFPWSTVVSGAASIYNGSATPIVEPTLWIKSGTYVETLTINRRMTLQSCGGVARIGG
ncbi:MAG: M12 family metallo-peptidase [Phycisphaerae bacterium]